MFFSPNAGEVRCIFTQTKQLSLNLHPTQMVKTKEKHIPLNGKNHILNKTWTTWCTYVLCAMLQWKTFHFHAILYLHKFHNTPLLPPKNTRGHCFRFLLGHLHVSGEIANNEYAKFGGGGGKRGVLWDLCK